MRNPIVKSSLLIAMLFMTVFVSGCIEIQALLSGLADTRDGGTSPSDGGGITPGDGTDDNGSTRSSGVQLTSHARPQLP